MYVVPGNYLRLLEDTNDVFYVATYIVALAPVKWTMPVESH